MRNWVWIAAFLTVLVVVALSAAWLGWRLRTPPECEVIAQVYGTRVAKVRRHGSYRLRLRLEQKRLSLGQDDAEVGIHPMTASVAEAIEAEELCPSGRAEVVGTSEMLLVGPLSVSQNDGEMNVFLILPDPADSQQEQTRENVPLRIRVELRSEGSVRWRSCAAEIPGSQAVWCDTAEERWDNCDVPIVIGRFRALGSVAGEYCNGQIVLD